MLACMEKKNNNVLPGKERLSKSGKTKKKSSAIAASQRGSSAVDNAKHSSKSDVSGNSGLTNSGPHVNYDEDK